jgi:hypothetical protein
MLVLLIMAARVAVASNPFVNVRIKTITKNQIGAKEQK